MVPSRVLGEGAKGSARDLSGTGPPRPRPGMISGSLPSVAAFLASRACCLEERAGAAFFAGAFLALVSTFLALGSAFFAGAFLALVSPFLALGSAFLTPM